MSRRSSACSASSMSPRQTHRFGRGRHLVNSVVYCEGAAVGAAGATTEAEEVGEDELVPFPDDGVGDGDGADVVTTAAVGLMYPGTWTLFKMPATVGM